MSVLSRVIAKNVGDVFLRHGVESCTARLRSNNNMCATQTKQKTSTTAVRLSRADSDTIDCLYTPTPPRLCCCPVTDRYGNRANDVQEIYRCSVWNLHDTRKRQYDNGPRRADTLRPGPTRSDDISARTRDGPLQFVDFRPRPGPYGTGPGLLAARPVQDSTAKADYDALGPMYGPAQCSVLDSIERHVTQLERIIAKYSTLCLKKFPLLDSR